MRSILPLIALSLGAVLAASCGAGDDDGPRGNVDFGEAGSGGTATGGDGGRDGGGAETGGTSSGGVEGDQPLGGSDSGGSSGAGGTVVGGGGLGGSGGSGGSTGGAVSGGTGGATGGQGTGGSSVYDEVGKHCAEHSECRPGQLCYDGLQVEQRTCRVQCDVETAGTQGTCRTGEVCALHQGGSFAGCLQVCQPFTDPGDCPAGEICYPSPDTSYTGGVEVSGVCLAAGSGTSEVGDSCETSDCSAELTCYVPAFDVLGFDHCAPVCDPLALPGEPGSCEVNETCREPIVGQPACLELCDPLGADTCGGSQWCAPFYDWDGTSVVEGHCVNAGALGDGLECTAGECGPGLSCAPLPAPYDTRRTCREVCDPSDPSCDGGAGCIDLVGGFTGLGTCEASCTVFDAGSAANCGADEWCAPVHLGGGEGTCVEPGSAVAGESCTFSRDCAQGLFCDCQYGQNSSCDTAVCVASCIPGAIGDGACEAGQTCTRLTVYGTTSAFGVCREVCDFDAGTDCTDSGETCVPGELLPDGVDACIDIPAGATDVGAPCFTLGVDDGDVCGPTHSCVIPADGGSATCEDVCRVSQGAVGTTNHPDCASSTATCTEIEAGLDYGLCR